jgi:hypothetical protein
MAGSLGLQATRGEKEVLAAESPRKFKAESGLRPIPLPPCLDPASHGDYFRLLGKNLPGDVCPGMRELWRRNPSSR